MKHLSRLIMPIGMVAAAVAVVFQDPLKTPMLRTISLVAAIVVLIGVVRAGGRARSALIMANASILVWFVPRIIRDLDPSRVEVEALGSVASMLLLGAAIVLVGGRPIGWHRRTELAALVPVTVGTGLAAGFLGVRVPPGIPAETAGWVAVLGWLGAGLLLAVIVVGVFDGRTHLRSRRLLLLSAGLILAPALACATPYVRCTSLGWVVGHLAIAAAALEVDVDRSVRTGARGPFRRTRLLAAVGMAGVPALVLLGVALIGGRDGRDPMALVGALVVAAVTWFAWRQTSHHLSREAGAVLKDWASGGAELDEDGNIVRWDDRAWALLGAEEPGGVTSLLERIDQVDRRPVKGGIIGAVAGRVSVLRCRTVTGAGIELVLAPGPHGPIAGVTMRPESSRLREASHQRAQQGQVSDPATGLMGRAAFAEALAHGQADPHREPVLIFVDIDGVNDVVRWQGREAAPFVVQTLADRLVQTVPSPNMVARLGADELAVLMPSPTRAEVGDLAMRILAALTHPLTVETSRFSVAIHLDVAVASEAPAEDVLRGLGAVSFNPVDWDQISHLPRRVPGAGLSN